MSPKSFTCRYANIFCATCHGELAALQPQTIRIGRPFCFGKSRRLIQMLKVAPMNTCFVLVALTFGKTFYDPSSMLQANSDG